MCFLLKKVVDLKIKTSMAVTSLLFFLTHTIRVQIQTIVLLSDTFLTA